MSGGSMDEENLLDQEIYAVNFMDVAEILNDGVIFMNHAGVILTCNNKFNSLTGIPREELVGHRIDELVEKGYFERQFINQVVYGKTIRHAHSESLVKEKMHLITGIPFFYRNNEEVRGIAITIRDTTELAQKQMRLEELEREKERTDEELERMKALYARTEIIGDTAVMRRLKATVLMVARREVAVLITGETGCGKEVIASAIQRNSERSDQPYIKVNCAAIPEQLMESELFGYEPGAFTGAKKQGKPGMFELANGGTILLDEIGDMPLSLQPKLLRVLQEKELVRVGGTKPIHIDVRVISATNQDLLKLCEEKKFREDLYYRLNVVPLKVPPLRERKPDIFLIATQFIERFNAKYDRHTFLTTPAIHELERYNWPGNVRELENIIERVVVFSETDMIQSSLVHEVLYGECLVREYQEHIKLDDAVNDLEYNMIKSALEKYGSTYKAAEVLGITQSRIMRKIKALNITV